MINKIKKLTEILVKDYVENMPIVTGTKKQKSIFKWMTIFVIGILTYVSYRIIEYLHGIGLETTFLKLYLPIILGLIAFQVVLICSYVLFFSKDIENIIVLPLKPEEILIAKFNNILFITYFSEMMFLFPTLIMYGIYANMTIIYFIKMILVLLIFPIIPILIISIIMMITTIISKIVKNKEIFQLIIIFVLTFIIFQIGIYGLKNTIFNNINIQELNDFEKVQELILKINNDLDKFNNKLICINPFLNLLSKNNFFINLWNLIKIISINIILFFILIIIGKKIYLKNILITKQNIEENKLKNKNKIKIKKQKSKNISYIQREIKSLFENKFIFIQDIFQYIIIVVTILLLINIFLPLMVKSMNDNNILENISENSLAIQTISMAVIIMQILFSFCKLSITAISKKGENAIYMKYIPISLYRQYIYIGLPQIFLNIITVVAFELIVANLKLDIPIIYYILFFIIELLIIILYSYILLFINFKNLNLDLTSEITFQKSNNNIMYQYGISIIIIMLIMYFERVFDEINIIKSLLILIFILFIILIIFMKIINININKIFEKIK